MEQRLSVLTTAARDLEAMRRFYEDTLGWEPLVHNADVVFYKMNGFLFSLTRRKFLAGFIGINEQGSGFTGVTLGCNYKSEAEVRAVYEKLRGRGVPMLTELTVPPFGGYFFIFRTLKGMFLKSPTTRLFHWMKRTTQWAISRSMVFDGYLKTQ